MDGGREWEKLPVIGQAFVGAEEFARRARKMAAKRDEAEQRYGLGEIVGAVSKVVRVEQGELRRPLRSEGVQRGREILMYLARTRGETSLKEMVRWLGVKEGSTVSHGVRRAVARLKEDRDFGRQVEQVLRELAHSPMQA